MAHALERRRPHLQAAPEADPRFRKVMDSLKHGAAKSKKHAPAAKKANEASAAAKGPANEKAAGGKSRQVDKLEAAPANKTETKSFLDMMREEIQSAMPQTLGDTEDFMKGDKPGEVKGSLKGSVNQATGKAAGDIKGASQGTPNEAGVPVKPVTAIPGEPAPATPPVQGAQAMPLPKSDKEVSLQDSKQDTEAEMKDAHVTPPQMRKANDPRFSAVLTAKDAVAKQADTAPAQYRVSEKGVLTSAASQAQAQGRVGALGMVGIRGRSNSAVLTKQAAAQAKEEKERKDVTDRIEAMYLATKVIVDLKLMALETEVGTMFDKGIDDAIQTMTSYVDARMDRYKADRYDGWFGGAKWLKDKLVGLPNAVKVFYKEGRRVFEQAMDALVVRVAARVELRLREAKNEVAKGQAAIATFVSGLKPSLQKVGKNAEKEVTEKFHELEQGIDDKKSQLAQSLAQKYKEAYDKADEALKKIEEANKGLVTAFVEKLGEIIQILREFKDKLLSLLRKAAGVIGLIVDDPIGFLKNMIAAIKQGFGQFVSNIWKHIKNGFMKWLFGNLADAGIELPADFSLPSILKLVLGVLGITYERMRAKAVKLIGERSVKFIEKVAEYVKELVTGGPAALWEKVKDDLSNLKEMVIDTIQNWLIETVVKRAIAKVVLLFNPVGAIIQAIMAIYDLVTFLIDKATQIMAVIESVIDSVAAIVAGDIDGAANRIEQSLADTIPLVIGFLASFIGLGGISKTVKGMITKVQNAVDKAIDKAIAKVVSFVRKLIGGGKEKGEAADPAVQKRWDDGMLAVRALAARAQAKAAPQATVREELGKIKDQYGFKELKLSKNGDKFRVHASMNPEEDVDINANSINVEEFTGETLWLEIAGRINVDEVPHGEGSRISMHSLEWNSQVLLTLIENSNMPPQAQQGAKATVARNLMAAHESRDEKVIYARVNAACRAVNTLYGVTVSAPGQLQAHHRPGVSAHSPMFKETRASRLRGRVATRIAESIASGTDTRLTREERAIANEPPAARPPLIRAYVEQLLVAEFQKKSEKGIDPLDEFDLDVFTRHVHLDVIHARR